MNELRQAQSLVTRESAKHYIGVDVWTAAEARAMTVDGLTTMRSAYGPEETLKRLEAEIRSKGMTVFAHINHAAGAAEAGLSLRPTDVLLFGNAKAGTPLMQSIQTIGIDLPLKVLVWQDAAGDTWLSYNDLQWIAKRHGVSREHEATISAISAALGALTKIVGRPA